MSTAAIQKQTRRSTPVIRQSLEPMRDYFAAHSRLIAAAIPPRLQSQINTGGVIASVLIDIEREPKLAACTLESLLRSTLLAVEVGARVGAAWGEAYLIPYGKEAQFQAGYRLLQRLAVESGAVETIHAAVVYENEVVGGRFELTYQPASVRHAPVLVGPRGAPVGAYFVGYKGTTIVGLEWASKDDIEKIRAAGQGNSPAWKNWWEEMARKSVTKRGLKRIPVGIDAVLLQRAITGDSRAERGESQSDLVMTTHQFDLNAQEQEQAARAAEEHETVVSSTMNTGAVEHWTAEIRQTTTARELAALGPRIGAASLSMEEQAALHRVMKDHEGKVK